jgi:hypothetical protein
VIQGEIVTPLLMATDVADTPALSAQPVAQEEGEGLVPCARWSGTPHPAHGYMLARRGVRCPGVPVETGGEAQTDG